MTRVLLTGWKELPLGKACKIYTGNSINEQEKKVKYTNLADGYNYIATKDITLNSVINYNNGIKIPFKETKFRVAPQNTSLLCIEGGSAGRKIGFTNQPVCFVNKLCAFCADTSLLDPYFLFFYLQTPVFKSVFQDKKTGLIGGVSTSKLKSLPILFPSLPEQKRIVEKLDKIFADIDKAKENTQKNLENAKEVFESTLRFLCTNTNKNWTSERADSYFVLQRGFDLPKHERKAGKYPLISSNGVTDYIDQYQVKAPVVTTGRSGTIGKVCYVDKDSWVLNTSLYIKDFKNNVPRFVYYFLQSMNLEQYASGAGVPTLNRNYVHEVVVNFPPKQEQSKIVAQLDTLHIKTQNLEKIYIKTLTVLEELKQSVLQQAFSGKL